MVGSFQLVLDQHPTIRPDVLAENVSTERPDRALLRLQLQINPERFAKDVEVLLSGKPGREIRRLRYPNVAKLDPFEATKILDSHFAVSGWPRCLRRFSGASYQCLQQLLELGFQKFWKLGFQKLEVGLALISCE